jgi:glycosyltransferase involved in cell wall biosynthesis
VKSGVNHFIICFDGDAVDNFLRKGLKVIVIQKPSSLFSYTFFVFSLIKLIRFNKIDIIHSHHRIFDSLFLIIQFFVKVKTVTSVQSKVFGRRIFSYKADKLIAVSKTISNHLENYYHKQESRIKLIYNFVSKDNFSDSFNSKPNRKHTTDQSIILFVGRLSKEKGVDTLLSAYKILISNLGKDKCFLQLVGNGPLKEYCINFIKKNELPADVVEPTYNIMPYYKCARMVVLPSRIDPFPLVMLEAGLMQKPFIGSKVDGIAEFIDNIDLGILSEPGDANKLAKAIHKVITNEKLAATLAKNLNAKVKKNYTADKILPEYEKLYRELLNE